MSHEPRDLYGTTFERTRLRDARFRWVDLSGTWIRQTNLSGVRMRGVELDDVQIDGELQNVVINGVEVAPLIEAELERLDPDYARMKPKNASGFREAWEILERRWADTVAHARTLEPDLLHESVDDEWSFIQTLRHLCYATDAWVNRVYLGHPDPWSPLDLPFTTMRDLEWPYDEDVRPSLDEVLVLRADRQATVRRVLADLTDERLAEETTPVEGVGWPPADSYPVAEALSIVLNEEWHHRRFAERDLAVLESRA
jgi:uncharacterized protein YjbI with pentapeptide repeats